LAVIRRFFFISEIFRPDGCREGMFPAKSAISGNDLYPGRFFCRFIT
jgi:hypothetical protein